jgi:hypothetical protein
MFMVKLCGDEVAGEMDGCCGKPRPREAEKERPWDCCVTMKVWLRTR